MLSHEPPMGHISFWVDHQLPKVGLCIRFPSRQQIKTDKWDKPQLEMSLCYPENLETTRIKADMDNDLSYLYKMQKK